MTSHSDGSVMRAYRIGGPRRGPHWAHRWHVDFFFRSWQSENPDLCRFARRGWSAGMAEWLMRRDATAEAAGRRTLYQRWRWWRARHWDAKHLTQQKTASRSES